MPDVDLKYAFGLEPKEAVRFFERKGFRITWDWHEMLDEAHARAFTVAKAMRTDILQDIHGELAKALREGITFADWKKNLTPRLKAKGWWGEVVNEETGEIAVVGAHRLKTIFETNIQTAYMTGHYQRMTANVESRPWWMYVAVMDQQTRPAHAALNGLVFRHDDPFWDSHYPPNGFRCRCSVRALDDAGLAEKIQSGEAAKRSTAIPPADAEIGAVAKPLTRDGRMAEVTSIRTKDLLGKEVAVATDPGWDYNPGKAALWHDPLGGVNVLPGQKTWRDFGRPDLREVAVELRTPAPELLPAGKDENEAAAILSAALGIAKGKAHAFIKAGDGDTVMVHRERLAHMVEKRADARERYGDFVVAALKDPFEVWWTEYEDGFRKQYIGVFGGKNDLRVVVRQEKDGTILWNVMQADDRRMNGARTGHLVQGK